MKNNNKILLIPILTFFIIALIIPLTLMIYKGVSIENITKIISDKEFIDSLIISILISFTCAILATLISVALVLFINYTNVIKPIKSITKILILLPMLLPSITFGFALMYLFGSNGLLFKIFNNSIINVYSYQGVILGYLIFIIGPTYLIVENTFRYLDGNLYYVSHVLNNTKKAIFLDVVLPAIKNGMINAFFIAFTLSFTDYGIPMSLNFNTASRYLYNTTLGSIPNLELGGIVALYLLLVPLIMYIIVSYLNSKNVVNENVTKIPVNLNKSGTIITGLISFIWLSIITMIFFIIIIVPFVNNWPNNLTFDLASWNKIFLKYDLLVIVTNTTKLALLTIVVGVITTFITAWYTTKTSSRFTALVDNLAMIPNIIPGMSIGLAYLLIIKNFNDEYIFIYLLILNVIHFFTSPYLLFKTALERLNPNYQNVSYVFGYSIFEFILFIVIPNIKATLKEVISYLFISSFTTISAIVFISNFTTETLSLSIKRLEYFSDFKGIFTVSLIILAINIIISIIKSNIFTREV